MSALTWHVLNGVQIPIFSHYSYSPRRGIVQTLRSVRSAFHPTSYSIRNAETNPVYDRNSGIPVSLEKGLTKDEFVFCVSSVNFG